MSEIIKKIDNYLSESLTPKEMQKIHAEFTEKYPHHEPGKFGINIRDMARILSGFKEYPSPERTRPVKVNKDKVAEQQAINAWISKAGNFSGDIAYEYTGGDQRKLERLSKKDLKMIYYDSLDQVNCPHELRDKVVKQWMNRGGL